MYVAFLIYCSIFGLISSLTVYYLQWGWVIFLSLFFRLVLVDIDICDKFYGIKDFKYNIKTFLKEKKHYIVI